MIKTILSISDWHVKPILKHEVAKKVFNKLVNHVKDERPDRVVIAGDLFHSKNSITNESIILIAQVLSSLAKYSKVIIIPGNHDTVIGGNRVDSISSVILAMNNPNIIYYKSSGTFEDKWDSELVWCVWSCLENQLPPDIKLYKEESDPKGKKHYIGLYHGVIQGSTTDLGFTFTDEGVDPADFYHTDLFIAGDIHKHQTYKYLNYKKEGFGVMCGSLYQQNFGESINNHGYNLLTLNNTGTWDHKLVEIDNDHDYHTLKLTDYEELENIVGHPKINDKSSIRVNWSDKIENYSKEKQKEIVRFIKNKFNVTYARVDFHPTNKINIGFANLETGDVENINSPEVQERIMLGWLKDNRIDITMDDIRRLNKRVEAQLIDFNDSKDNKWKVKKLRLYNFMSYGDETIIDFEKLKGLTLIQGGNFQGKTTILDALVYLLFNTTPRTKLVDEIINRHNDLDFARVEGELEIDGIDYQIVREVKRKWNKDKSTYKTPTTLQFMTKNEEGVYEEAEKEEDRKATDKKIKEHVGSYDEFLMTVVCTGDNIFDLINAGSTERGQLLSRFLGLEIYEKKEAVAKKMYADWKVKAKIDKYSSSDLQLIIDNTKNSISLNEISKKEYKKELIKIIDKKQVSNKEKSEFLSFYHNDIDKNMANLPSGFYENKIKNIESEVSSKTLELEQTQKVFLNDVEKFDQTNYDSNIKLIDNLSSEIKIVEQQIKEVDISSRKLENSIKDVEGDNKVINSELTTLRATITTLKSGAKCPECGQKLADVDHTEVIKTKTTEGISKKSQLEKQLRYIDEYNKSITDNNGEKYEHQLKIDEINTKISDLENKNKILLLVKEKNTANDLISLKIDKISVELEMLEIKLVKEKDNLLKYNNDLNKIETNITLDEKIRLKNIEITNIEENERNENKRITSIENEIAGSLKVIEENEILIDTIKKEEHIAKVFLCYMNMVGKNGISKTIMNNSIPVLNLELANYLKDSAEFTVEIEINDKNNEVEFWLVDNETGKKGMMKTGSGYERTIGSLAIRIVNSKINALPKPSLLLVDEIFSTVQTENLELIKAFLDKVSSSIDNVFIITHNEHVKEWAEHIITVSKTNNISKAIY